MSPDATAAGGPNTKGPDGHDTKGPTPPGPEPKAPGPRGLLAAALPAVLLGLVLCGVAALCVRELIVFAGWIDGAPWLANAAEWIAQLQWQDWMRYAAPAAILVGALLLLAAVAPRRRTHVRLRAATDIWLQPTDIARLCSAATFEFPEVLTASTTVGRKDASVSVTAADEDGGGHGDLDDLRERITERVSALVAELEQPLAVSVTVRPGVAHAPDQRRRVI